MPEEQRNPDSLSKIAEALAKAQGEFPAIQKLKTATVKTKTGGEYKYSYADWSDVLKAVLPILSKHNIAFVQQMKRTDLKLCIRTRLIHISGEILESDGISIPETLDPQSFGSVLSYWKRYDGCALLGIAPDEDDDAARATAKDKKSKQEKQFDQNQKAAQPLTPTGVRQFWSAANQGGKKPAEIKAYLANLKVATVEELPQGDLDLAIKWALGTSEPIQIDQKDMARVFATDADRGVPPDDVRRYAHETYKVEHMKDLTKQQMGEVLEWVKQA